MSEPDTPPDPEAGWPPRFSGKFVGAAGLLLLATAVVAALWLRGPLVGESPSAQDTMSYMFAVAGLFMLLVGVFFGLVEARRPPVVTETVTTEQTITGQNVPGSVVTEVVKTVGALSEAIGMEKRSTAAWSLGFALLLLAAVSSGVVSLSVGDDATGDDAAGEIRDVGQDDEGDDGGA